MLKQKFSFCFILFFFLKTLTMKFLVLVFLRVLNTEFFMKTPREISLAADLNSSTLMHAAHQMRMRFCAALRSALVKNS